GMMPAAAFLEIARAAAEKSATGTVTELGRIVWPQPMVVDQEGAALTTSIETNAAQHTFLITSEVDECVRIHCQGTATTAPADEGIATSPRDIPSIESRCRSILDKVQCNALLLGTHGARL